MSRYRKQHLLCLFIRFPYQNLSVGADETALGSVPDGIYNMSWKLRRWGNKTAKGKMQVVGGKYIILAGSDVCPNEGHGLMDIVRMKRENANIVDDKLQEES